MKHIAIAAVLACSAPQASPKVVGPPPQPPSCATIAIDESTATRIAAIEAIRREALPSCRAELTERLARALGVSGDDVLRVAASGENAAATIPEATDRPALASPDGTRFAIVLPHRVAIYVAATGLPIGSLPLDTGGVNVALLDGGAIVAASFRGVFVLDANGNRRATLRAQPADAPYDEVVPAASPDGRRVALIGQTSIAVVGTNGAPLATIARDAGARPHWAVWRGRTVAVWDGRSVEVWRDDGTTLARVARRAGRVDVVDLKHGPINEIIPHIAVAHDGSAVAVHAASQIDIIAGDGATRTIALTRSLSAGALGYAGTALYARDIGGDLWRIDPDPPAQPVKERLALGRAWSDVGGTIRAGTTGRLELVDGAAVVTARLASGPPLRALAWTPDGGALVAAAGGEFVMLSADGVAVARSPVFADRRLVVAPAGRAFWLIGRDGVATWALDDRAPTPASLPSTTIVAFTSDGKRAVIAPDPQRDLELRDLATGAVVATIHLPALNDLSPTHAWFVDRDKLLVVGHTRTIVWNVALKVTTWTIDEEPLGVSPDGGVLVTSNYGKLKAYDVARQRALGELAIDTIDVQVAFRPDGKQVAIGTRAGTITIVDLPAWTVARTIAAHDLEVTALAWRPDGAELASASAGGVVAIWGADGARRATIALGPIDGFEPRAPAPAWVAVFPDGRAYGPPAGRDRVMTTIAGVPIGTGSVGDADATAWRALYTVAP
jgi:hypothetical protein